jgi:hypothetical protein
MLAAIGGRTGRGSDFPLAFSVTLAAESDKEAYISIKFIRCGMEI